MSEQPSAENQLGARAARAFDFADLSGYSFRRRLAIRAADRAFHLAISLLGRTARFRVEGWEHWEAAHAGGPAVLAFWHEQIFLTTYHFRRRRIVVMTSRSFDGEYIARFIQRFGYGAARGSSSRGGAGALVEMARLVRAGFDAGFTIDGPRGPRRVAKMGPVLLAKKTGRPVLPFAVVAEKCWAVRSWDRLQIPRPFTRAAVRLAPPLYVPADAGDGLLEEKRDELQRALDGLSDAPRPAWRAAADV